MAQTHQDLVSTDWLQQQMGDHYLRIVDCRWVLGQPGEGHRLYEEGHITGALHLDVDDHLSGKEGPGRHPIPNKRDFENILSEMGIAREHHVVAYDDGQGAPAARLWWLMKFFGHDNVSVLDGGWNLWTKEGRATEREMRRYISQKFFARAKHVMTVDMEGMDTFRTEPDVVVIDARAPERYRGEVEPIDARAGHIPGAENFFFKLCLDPATGKFLPPAKLKALFQELGVSKDKTVISYCGSGITACTNVFALKLAGFNSKLYEGSWSEWSKDSQKPLAK
ncbi:MAG: sulfurtransferase [Deltaproteobacteria bacterium]|nr:MAG: sulfurtransferase [Deltaproteobacteria bacterium]